MTVEPFDFGDGVPHHFPHSPRHTVTFEPNRRIIDPVQRQSGHGSGYYVPAARPRPAFSASETQSARTDSTRSFDIDATRAAERTVGDPQAAPERGGWMQDRPSPANRSRGGPVETHTSVGEKPRVGVRGFSLVLAVVGHALVGSLIVAGGNLILGAVSSVAIMSCSAALVATEALANQ